MGTRYLRYMAATDDSTFGRIALEYLRSLLRIAPVRVAAISPGGMSGCWSGYAPLLGTPMDGDFVNIVCCQPARWSWMMSVAMQATQTGAARAVATERIEFHTAGVRNVLLAGHAPADQLSDDLRAAALRYEQIVTMDEETAESWRQAGAGAVAVIPVPVVDHDAVRVAVLG